MNKKKKKNLKGERKKEQAPSSLYMVMEWKMCRNMCHKKGKMKGINDGASNVRSETQTKPRKKKDKTPNSYADASCSHTPPINAKQGIGSCGCVAEQVIVEGSSWRYRRRNVESWVFERRWFCFIRPGRGSWDRESRCRHRAAS